MRRCRRRRAIVHRGAPGRSVAEVQPSVSVAAPVPAQCAACPRKVRPPPREHEVAGADAAAGGLGEHAGADRGRRRRPPGPVRGPPPGLADRGREPRALVDRRRPAPDSAETRREQHRDRRPAAAAPSGPNATLRSRPSVDGPGRRPPATGAVLPHDRPAMRAGTPPCGGATRGTPPVVRPLTRTNVSAGAGRTGRRPARVPATGRYPGGSGPVDGRRSRVLPTTVNHAQGG